MQRYMAKRCRCDERQLDLPAILVGFHQMANVAKLLLQEDYGLGSGALAKVQHIPHGVPVSLGRRPIPSPGPAKRALGLSGRRLLSTCGLITEGKGIEYMLHAMAPLAAAHPDLLYLVIGSTHPEVRRRDGERYRAELLALTGRLGLERHVQFVDRFLPQTELLDYLAATDVYVTPYLDRDQITSGTLAYALGCGKAIVSTPYLYAAEALAEGRGLLAEFRNAESLAHAVDRLLSDCFLRRHVETEAARYGAGMSWPAVAARYGRLFRRVLAARGAGGAARKPYP